VGLYSTAPSSPGGGAAEPEIVDWASLGNLGASETVTGVDDELVRVYGTLDAATAITIATAANQQIDLQLTQDGTGSRNPTWSGIDVWRTPGGIAPNLTGRAAGAVDRFHFEDIGGTCYGEWITQFPAAHYAEVAATETRTSATYGDLTTPGPAVTHVVPASGSVKVTLAAFMIAPEIAFADAIMSFAMSGANVAAAGGQQLSAGTRNHVNASSVNHSRTFVVTGLSPGSTTFTAKYARSSGGTAYFGSRSILVEDM
jgi:hypothetical protein